MIDSTSLLLRTGEQKFWVLSRGVQVSSGSFSTCQSLTFSPGGLETQSVCTSIMNLFLRKGLIQIAESDV
jgi:hypothetical protein